MELDKSSEKIKKNPKVIDCSNCKYKCSLNFSQDLREKICHSFQKLDYSRQKDYILANVKSTAPKRRRPTKEVTEIKRTNSKTFHLCDKRVCQAFFLKTLAISNGPLNKAFQHKNKYTNFFDAADRRGKHQPSNKIKPEIINTIVDYLSQKCIPENTGKFRKKVICDTNVRSLRTLHSSFKELNSEYCPSYTTFKRIFYENNFSLPQERLRYKPFKSDEPKNESKIEIKSIEVVNFDTQEDEVIANEVDEECDEASTSQQQHPKVIVTQIPENSKFLSSQAEVYEIQFIHLPTLNTL